MTSTLSYPSALDDLHRRSGMTCSPSGYVLASPAMLAGAEPGPLERLGLAVGRRNGTDTVQDDLFADGLVNLHRELLLGVIEDAMRHLESRTSGGSTLLSMQLVQGQLADIALRLSLDAAVSAADPQARWRSYQRLVAVGRSLLRLFGARGFLAGADGPARDLHLAEIAGNVYLHPEGNDPND